jgi:hypothetical protein
VADSFRYLTSFCRKFIITKSKFEPEKLPKLETLTKDKDAIILVNEDSQSDMQVDEDNDCESSHHTEQKIEAVLLKETACCTDNQVDQEIIQNVIVQPTIDDNVNTGSLVLQTGSKKALDNPQEFEEYMLTNNIPKSTEFTEKLADRPALLKIEEEKDYEKTQTLDSDVDQSAVHESMQTEQCQTTLKEHFINQLLMRTKLMQANQKLLS